MSATATRTHVARRTEHLCHLCNHKIVIGQTYKTWRYFHYDNDAPVTVTVHPDCNDLWQEHNDDPHEPWYEDTLNNILESSGIYEALKAAKDDKVRAIWMGMSIGLEISTDPAHDKPSIGLEGDVPTKDD